jgi:hypothetical protein
MPRVVRKRRTREHIIADMSVNHVEARVLRCGYSVERIEHDYGTDLAIFTYDAQGELESGYILVQLKATDRLRVLSDGKTISFPVRRADLASWLGELMPYILIVYDAPADVAYWLYIQEAFERRAGFSLEHAPATITVHVPVANVLTEDAVRHFARSRDAILRQVKGVIHHG